MENRERIAIHTNFNEVHTIVNFPYYFSATSKQNEEQLT